MARQVHLVGSIPLADAESVFQTVAATLGPLVARIPDGETGERSNFVGWQVPVLFASPSLAPAGAPPAGDRPAGTPTPPFLARRPDTTGAPVIGELGYAASAIASYAVFTRLRDDGIIPAGTRFQVSLPTPRAVIMLMVVAHDREEFLAAYRDKLRDELAKITTAIPAHDLAVQWDVSVEMGWIEGVLDDPADVPADVIDRVAAEVADLDALVPDGITRGFHLCYGDLDHAHFVQPRDTANLVRLANALTAAIDRDNDRGIDWLHLPVPADRIDEQYFAPLIDLDTAPIGQVFLGLVHNGDGVEGALERVAAAHPYLADFGIATECGLGRRDPATIPALLELHRQIVTETG